jgi:transcriptional regulator with XRE-family HTH domain
LTQEEVAAELNLSRASYIAIEQGKRELTVSEKDKLESLFGVSTEGTVKDQEKYREMILEFLSLPEFEEGIPKTKLAKLLYLADFGWFYNHLESMSGMQYRRIQYGPVPDYYFRAIEEMFGEDGSNTDGGFIDIQSREREGGNIAFMISATRTGKVLDRKLLSGEEKEFIKEVGQKWQKARTQEIVRFTHEQLPYKICRDGEIIPYSLITQEEPDKVY